MKSTLGVRLMVRLGATLLVVWPAFLFAGNLERPEFASIPGDPDLVPLRELIKAGRTDEAEAGARARLGHLADRLGADAGRAADLREILLDCHVAGGGHAAEELRREADDILSLRTRLYGRDDLRRIPSLWQRGYIAFQSGESPQIVIDLMQEMLRIGLLRLGPEHPDLADLYRAVGISRNNGKQPDEALAAFARCIDLGERLKNLNDHAVVTCLGSSAASWTLKGDLQRSVLLRREAVTRLEQGGSDLSPLWTVLNVDALSGELVDAGEFSEASALLQRWSRRLARPEDPAHGLFGLFLAMTGPRLLTLGDYAGARHSAETSLQSLAGDHTEDGSWAYLSALHCLAELYMRLGDWPEARTWGEKALEETRRRLPYSYSNTYVALINLAQIEVTLRHLERALLLLEEAARLSQGTSEQEDLTSVATLALLSVTREGLGRIDDARRTREDMLARLDRGLQRTPTLAAAQLNWPVYRRAFESLGAGGIPVLEKSAQVIAATYGENSVALGEMLSILAILRLRASDLDGALRDALRVERIGNAHLREVSDLIEERLALTYTAVRPSGRDVLLDIASRTGDVGNLERAWESVAQSRALVLDEIAMRHRTALRSGDAETLALAEALTRARERFAARQVLAASSDEPQSSARLDAARREMERLERELASRRQPAAPEMETPKATGLSFLDSLPSGAELVAYYRYRPVGSMEGQAADKYLALTAGGSGGPIRMVRLGEAAGIDRAIAAWRAASATPPRGSGRARRSAETAYREAARLVAQRIWWPLGIDLDRASAVFVVPDGQIHLVNIATLVDPGGRYLVEHPADLHFLGSERDLIAPDRKADVASGLLALGGPAFDESVVDVAPHGAFRGTRASCDGSLQLSFAPLPGARREVEEIGTIWKRSGGEVTTLTGAAASEGAVKRLAPSEGVLHFATHGVVWGADCPPGKDRMEGSGPAVPDENPLRLSFLALAGANRADQPSVVARTEAKPGEDGILTSEEIASLDLSNVRWAVLSACDTARGPVLAGEGVLGLRRAFTVAGAATTIMSLWPVGDDDARQWMVSLYKHRLAGTTTAAAVHAAGLDVLKARRARGLDTHPARWGAFVAAGDWR